MAGGPMVDAHERLPLDTGWKAVATEPGAADHLLAGLDDRMLPAVVPGTAAAALLEAGDELEGRDVDAEDWWFRCRFASPPEEPGTETVLRLEGLATLADAWLDGRHVLSSASMFEPQTIKVDQPGRDHELAIRFGALAAALAAKRPRARWRTRLVSEPHLRFVRTTLLGRIPAFAPGPAPVGPWLPVVLERRRHLVVEDAQLTTSLDGDDGLVRARLELRTLGGTTVDSAVIVLDGPSGSHRAALVGEGTTVAGELRVARVAHWWPHTHGDPALHALGVELETSAGPLRLDWGRVGFRRLAATTEPGLELRVNGERIFARGGTLMPELASLSLTGERLRSVLLRARDAGMNTIRLSGVATYASDELLDLCDELGILVWQDFAFANLDYPADDEDFRAAVEREAAHFVRRAGGRACLAVLCGNSEIEQQVAMLGLDPGLGRGPLFGELLPELVAQSGVDAVYVPSSPSGGPLPFAPGYGVAHYFGVGAYRRPLEDTRRAGVRFASECLAFANVPSDEALAEVGGDWTRGVPRDTGAEWDFADVRDHYLAELYGVDPAGLRESDSKRYVALSRVVTGEVMAAVLGEWRRAASTCAGALLWWLNDVLPGSGWGVLDSRGRPKSSYWYVRRALAPIAVWMTDEGTNGVAVHVANDRPETLEAVLRVELHRSDGVLTDEVASPVFVAPRTTVELSVEGLLGRFVDAGYAFRFGPPSHDVIVASLVQNETLFSQAFHFPLGRPARTAPLADLGLDAVVTEENGAHLLRVRSERLAYAVALDVPGFAPDDDVFTVAPGGERAIRLTPLSGRAVPKGTISPLNADGRLAIRTAGTGGGTE